MVINNKQAEGSLSPENENENKKSVVVVAEPEANEGSSSTGDSAPITPVDVPPVPVNNGTTAASNQTTSESSSVEPSASSTPNQTHAEIVRAAGAVVVNKAEMQSFEEWKEMKLKSGGETENEPTGSSSSSSSSGSSQDNSDPASTSPLSQQNVIKLMGEVGSTAAASSAAVHRRKNYASAECGAKIIASNPEANKPSNILSENKDDYMLNSCTNRIWFVIELCEPVRITEFELANFELFSNVPRQFRVYASERYLPSSPTSNWQQKYLIGTFEAANVRTEQKFSIKDTSWTTSSTTTTAGNKNNGEQSATQSTQTNSNGGNNGVDSSPTTNGTTTEQQQQQQQQSSRQPAILMYAKYVRFEMISHYGKEHYCPLSLVRVFGTSITDEEEAASPDSAEAILLGGSGAHHDTIVDALLSSGDETAKSKSSERPEQAAEKQSKSQDFLNRLVSEKDKLISNIIATFLGENFNLSKLFTLFSFNTGKNFMQFIKTIGFSL